MRYVICALALIALVNAAMATEEPIAIPYITDPTPIMDGNLQEWQNRGVLREITRPEQATYNRGRWKNPEDLSGWVRFGYNHQNLFIACHVVDNVFSQDQGGNEAWRGDHVMVNLDFILSGKKGEIWRLGLTPGNLKPHGAPGPELDPELVIWLRPGAKATGSVVAARRTPVGYDIEAAIPWKLLKVTLSKYLTFGAGVAFSDCDTSPTVQEKAMSISTAPWDVWDTKRLIPAVLADRTGKYPADAFLEPALLAKDVKLSQNDSREFVVDLAEVPEGRIPTLTFKARADHATAAGCCGALLTTINGKSITHQNIANRPAQMTAMNGMTLSAWYAAGVRLWFGPSYDTIERSQYKPLDIVSYDYTLRLDNRFQKGKNVIAFKNVDARPSVVVIMDDVRFNWSPPSRFPPPKEWKPAPTGPLPVMEPLRENKVRYQVVGLPGGALKVTWAGRNQVFTSRFSKPDGTWAVLGERAPEGWLKRLPAPTTRASGEQLVFSGQTDVLQLTRTVTALDECILVRDTIENISKDVERPLMISHTTPPGACETLWLAGRLIPNKIGAAAQPSNPSVVVLGKDSGFGLLARDDIFRIHSLASCDKRHAEVADNSLVLRPGITYRHEWLIFPLARPDYWLYVNAARRHFKTNFPIEGGFFFFRFDTPAWRMLKQIEWGGTKLVSLGPQQYYKGMFPHGPMMTTMDQTKVTLTHKTLQAIAPRVRSMSYSGPTVSRSATALR